MAAVMTSDKDNTDRLAIEIAECKSIGIDVLSPDINQSFVEFAVVPGQNQIRFGMAAIKGVGVGAVEEVLRARDQDGKFSSIEDFAKRVSTSKFNRKAWESLIKSGAFDNFGDRSDILFNLDTITSFASKVQKEASSGQTDLFGALVGSQSAIMPTMDMKPAPAKHTDKERLSWERELLGLYISAHPLDSYAIYLSEQTQPLSQLVPEYDSRQMTVGGIISSVRTIITKSGSKMAFVALEDKFGEGEVIVFPNLFEQHGAKLIQDTIVTITGKNSARDREGNLGNESKLIADDIVIIGEGHISDYQSTGEKVAPPKVSPKYKQEKRAQFQAKKNGGLSSVAEPKLDYQPVLPKPVMAKRLFIHVKDPNDQGILVALKSLCRDYVGEDEVILVLGDETKSAMRLPFRVEADDPLITGLVGILGKDCVSTRLID